MNDFEVLNRPTLVSADLDPSLEKNCRSVSGANALGNGVLKCSEIEGTGPGRLAKVLQSGIGNSAIVRAHEAASQISQKEPSLSEEVKVGLAGGSEGDSILQAKMATLETSCTVPSVFQQVDRALSVHEEDLRRAEQRERGAVPGEAKVKAEQSTGCAHLFVPSHRPCATPTPTVSMRGSMYSAAGPQPLGSELEASRPSSGPSTETQHLPVVVNAGDSAISLASSAEARVPLFLGGSASGLNLLGNLAGQTANRTAARIIETEAPVEQAAGGHESARALASAALTGSPSERLIAPGGRRSIALYDTPAAHKAADRMGAFAFVYHDSIFMGRDPGIPGAPTRSDVLRHEIAHVLQGRQLGPVAERSALERQASEWQGGSHLLASDPDEAYGLLWIPFAIAAGYILLKPNTANAPGPGDKTYKSMDTKDYAKTVIEAAVLASGGGVASSLRKAGYSVVTTWGVSGAYGSVASRGVQDIYAGSFSGLDAYVVDAVTGASIGILVGGTFYAAGKVPGISRVREWFTRGAENDKAWANLPTWREKLRYEIGQKTLASDDEFAKVSHLSPLERGTQFIKQQGWLKALSPNSPKFLPGTGGTFSTGPTPGARWFLRSATGFGAGATGNYLLGDTIHDVWGTGMNSYGTGMELTSSRASGQGASAPTSRPTAPAGSVIYVVPAGEELSYLINSGRVGDFPVPENTPGLNEARGTRSGNLSTVR